MQSYLCAAHAGDAADRLEVVQGDVTQPNSLAAAAQGAAGVIFTAAGHGNGFLGTAAVDYEVGQQVLTAAEFATPHLTEAIQPHPQHHCFLDVGSCIQQT